MSDNLPIHELAAKIQGGGIMGQSDGKRDKIFMRDTYNLMPVLMKSAIILTEQHIHEYFNADEQEPATNYMVTLAKGVAMIFKGGATLREENCHIFAGLMEQAANDPVKLKTYTLFCNMFTRVYMSMPLLIPKFGAVLDDNVSDAAILTETFLALVEGLPDTERKLLAKSLQDVGAFKDGFDLSTIKRACLNSAKDIVFKNMEKQ